MTTYFWDFGVDQNAVTHPLNSNMFYLQNGFCTETEPATPVNLLPGDRNLIRIFDVTNTNGSPSAFSLVSGKLRLDSAITNQESHNPFDVEAIPFATGIHGGTSSEPGSTATLITFGPSSPLSTNLREKSPIFSGMGDTTFPVWHIIVDPGLNIQNPGRYLFSAEVTVQETGTQTEKIFHVDPEMIVEGVG